MEGFLVTLVGTIIISIFAPQLVFSLLRNSALFGMIVCSFIGSLGAIFIFISTLSFWVSNQDRLWLGNDPTTFLFIGSASFLIGAIASALLTAILTVKHLKQTKL